MRIAFLARSLDHGGAERQLTALARGLQARGHEVAVLLFYAGGPLARELEEAGVPSIDLAKSGRWDVGPFLLRAREALRQIAPDVVYGFLAVPNLVALLARSLKARPRIVWGIRASDMDLSRYDALARLSYALEARFAGLADLVIANSEAGANAAAARGFPRSRLAVVRNGIDTERFRPDPEARQALRRWLGLGEDAVLIGHAGRFDPMKDHWTFMEAAGILARQNPSAHFVLCGEGVDAINGDLALLMAATGLSGRCHLLGPRTDMEAIFPALDLFCLSSAFGEGFPNVLGEAMACGAPCASTEVGDAAAILGGLGALAPPGRSRALAQAMGAVLDRLRREGEALRREVRERIVCEFGETRMIERTEESLRRLIEAR